MAKGRNTRAGKRALVKASVAPIAYRDVMGHVRESFPGAWQKNVIADSRECTLAFSAAYACITRIAHDVAKLRIKLVEKQPDGTSPEIERNSPFLAVLRKPNAYQTRIQFIEQWLLMKLLHGNTYVVKERDMRGIVTAMHILDSRRVHPLVTVDGSVYYQLSSDSLAGELTGRAAPAMEIIHDRGPTLWHPLCGVPPLYAFAASATQGNRIQANSARFFENMSRPSGVLTAPGVIDEPTALRLKNDWEMNYSGGNIGRLAVLGSGLKYDPMTIPAQTAQLIEQLRWTVEDVARACGMPLYKIGAGPIPTSNNVEALQQQYYDDCLQILIESIEACLDDGLQLPAGMSTEMDLDGLLRMDSATRITMLAEAVQGGLMKPNEGRLKLNLPPVEGGDQVYLQQQNFSLEALAKRDALADPFGSAPTEAAEPVEEEPVDDSAQRAMLAIVDKAIAEVRLSTEIAGNALQGQREAQDEAQRAKELLDSESAALQQAKALSQQAADEAEASKKLVAEMSAELAVRPSVEDEDFKAFAAALIAGIEQAELVTA